MFGKRTNIDKTQGEIQKLKKSILDTSDDSSQDKAPMQKNTVEKTENSLSAQANKPESPPKTNPAAPPPKTTPSLSTREIRKITVQGTPTTKSREQSQIDKRSDQKRMYRRSPERMAELTKLKDDVYSNLIEMIDITRLANADKEVAAAEIREICIAIIATRDTIISSTEQEMVLDEICDDILGYGPLEPLLARDDIADIMVNGANKIFIETNGRIEMTDIHFKSNQQLLEICQRMVSKVGRRVDEASPICDARLLDGSRINVIAPPLAIDGVNLTIRKFKKDKLKMSDLVKYGSIHEDGGILLKIIGACRCNVIVSGGTGSGKTTLLNCLSSFAGNDERIITCEDSAELQLQQPHVVRLETRPASLEGSGEVTMRDLVKNCLRMRPERIIVGEVRGPEAFDLLQAMNTGHDGSMGTLHANSPREAISRLEAMITMGGFGLPVKVIREMISNAVDIIVQTQRLRDGTRRITHITEVLSMEGETITTQDLLTFEITGEDDRGYLIGEHLSSGVGRPEFRHRAQEYNLGNELDFIMNKLNREH
jgi:pilus assembly protein CpaF